MKTCAVLPAAGLGTRLGLNIPKLLAPVSSGLTVWSILREKLISLVDHIHIVASPFGKTLIEKTLNHDISNGLVSLSIQPKPIGMGDAVFCGKLIWENADTILIVWADQIFVSQQTLQQTLARHDHKQKTITLPLVWVQNPYVEYVFNKEKKLISVQQSREGEFCNTEGYSDVGTFALSTESLVSLWENYLTYSYPGKITGELNFLPFLPFLSQHNWRVQQYSVTNPNEARGINTPEDLAYFCSQFAEVEP